MECLGPVDRSFDAFDGASVGAGNDDGIGVLPCRDRSPYLGHRLGSRDDLLVLHVPALLRSHLVLEVEAGDPRLLVELDGADDVYGVAVAGVHVRNQWDGDGRGDAPDVLDHLGEREQPDIGAPEQRRGGAEPGHVGDVEARFFDQTGREPVVAPGCGDDVAGAEELA